MNWIKNWNYKEKNGKSMEKDTKGSGTAGIRFLTGLWAFLMMTVFPFYMRNHYSKMGVHKSNFFLAVSVLCLVPAALLWVGQMILDGNKPEKRAAGQRPGGKKALSALDIAVLLYMGAAVLSWAVSVDRRQAFTGIKGWSMGLGAQLLFGLIYFLVSRQFPWKKIIFTGHFLASGAVFVLGILHRFLIDPLGMYEGIDEYYHLLFLSTIGQASWYSSYVCTVLVIGVTIFFLSKKPVLRIAMGVYCMLGFATVVTQNSDSAFAAMAFLFFGLFLAACDSLDKMERFFETVLLMLGSFKIMGVLQELFSERALQLGRLSEFLSKSTMTWILFLAVCLVYMAFLLYRQKHPDREKPGCGKALRLISMILVPLFLFLYVFAVWANTTGHLQEWFGITGNSQYFLFDRYWGNSRGFSWKFTWETFLEFPPLRKLFGVGPDCFSVYCYREEELAAKLNHFFGHNQNLINAHNEFLNTLFNLGILGLIPFVMIFAAAVLRFFKNRKQMPLALMGMLAALVYAAHNFFCYQQVCCTPFLFLILGMAENLLRNGQKTAADYLP